MSEGAKAKKGAAPAPSPQLLQKLGVSLPEWQEMPDSEKKARLENYLKELKASAAQTPSAPAPGPSKFSAGGSTEAALLHDYFRDDTTVRAPDEPGPVVFKMPDREIDIQADGRTYARIGKRNEDALGFAVTDEAPEPGSTR